MVNFIQQAQRNLSENERWRIMVIEAKKILLATNRQGDFDTAYFRCIDVLNDYPEPVRICVVAALSQLAIREVEKEATREAEGLAEFEQLEAKNARPQ